MAHNPFIQQGKAIPNNVRDEIVERWLNGTGQRQIGRDLLQRLRFKISLIIFANAVTVNSGLGEIECGMQELMMY